MAVTRKLLKALGIEDEKADQILEAHTETVNEIREERDRYKADAEQLPGVQKELAELKDSFAVKKAQWENEKNRSDNLSRLREEIDAVSREIPASRMLIAALVSLSSVAPHPSQVHLRSVNVKLVLTVPQMWQALLLGSQRSTFTTILPFLRATHSRI